MPAGSFGRAVVVSFLIDGIAGLLRLATPVLLARSLGAGDYGIFAVATSVTLMIFSLANLGLPAAAVYFVARDRRLSVERQIFRLSGIVTLGACLVSAPGSWRYLDAAGVGRSFSVSLLAVAAVLPYTLENVGIGILRGQQRVELASSLGLTRHASVLIGVGLLAGVGATVENVLALHVVVAVTLASGVARLSGLGATVDDISRSTLSTRTILAYGLRVQASTLVTFLSYRIDLLILGILVTTADAGRYAAVVAVAEAVWFVSVVAASSVSGRLAGERDERLRAELAERVCRLVTAGTLLITVLLAIGGGVVLSTLFGDSFRSAHGTLVISLVGTMSLAPSRILSTHRAAAGRPQDNIGASVAALIVNIVLNLLFVPPLGIEGAALATAVSYTLVLFDRTQRHILSEEGAGRLSTLFLVRRSDIQTVIAAIPRRAGGQS